MRAAKMLAVLAIAALGIGSLSAVALAGKSYKRKALEVVEADFCDPAFSIPDDPKWVCHGPNPTVDKTGLVIAQVELFQIGSLVPACWESRSIRLQVLDTNGVVLTTLDGTRTGKREKIRTLSGQLPTTLPAGTNYVRVKMKKRTVPLGGTNYQTKSAVKGNFLPGRLLHRITKVGKLVCGPGFSRNVAIPAVNPPGS
jgi:hypothetical protein